LSRLQNVLGTIRRECLNHVIVLNERHLKQILSSYVEYYNETRTHESLSGDSPNSRVVQFPNQGRNVVAISQVGGLHHRYERRAA
jgi:putative transposase